MKLPPRRPIASHPPVPTPGRGCFGAMCASACARPPPRSPSTPTPWRWPRPTPPPPPGDTVTLTATVKKDGTAVTDLSAKNLTFSFWFDCWNDHTDGEVDGVVANGSAMTTTVTVPSEGTYYLMAEAYDAANSYALVASACIPITVERAVEPVEAPINVDIVKNLPADFAMGVDISSIVSEFESGVTFRDHNGNAVTDLKGFCALLAASGVTHVRVRVWNDPQNAAGSGYGGGNCDVNNAVAIATACKEAGLKMLIDFHCSDFWADPGKQKAPKAWAGYTVTQKAEAVKSFIGNALTSIKATGANVAMVQVGNETTGGFAGVTDTTDMCTLFKAGIEAVHAAGAKAVIHVTNPEKGNVTSWAKTLNSNGVDYDILATSYYPYWHGSLENLTSELKTVKDTYGKDVMVAETSYAYTLDDTDGHANTVRTGNNDSNPVQPFTVQGQANSVRNVINAVNNAGGMGVFYWEPAWITVGDTTGLTGSDYDAKVAANKVKWEQYGSGWAASYAAEYDANDAGKWYGGSAVDNEALFYPDGSPTAALKIWQYVRTGAVSNAVTVDSIVTIEHTIEAGESYTLPDTVAVAYNKGTVAEAVTWNARDVDRVNVDVPGLYCVNGTVTLSRTVTDGTYKGQTTVPTTFTLQVTPKNLITDKDDAGFESGENFAVEGTGLKDIPSTEDVLDGSGGLHWYSASASQPTVTYTKVFSLEPGQYSFMALAMGAAGDTINLQILDKDGNVLFSGVPRILQGWGSNMEASLFFNLEKATDVKLRLVLGIQDGGWGSADMLRLFRLGDPLSAGAGAPAAAPQATSARANPATGIY